MQNKKLKMSAWLVVFSLMFGFGVLGVSVIGQTKAQETVVSEESVDYYLSYPGILPDNPFYWVKMIRDRVQLWLTVKPEQKTEKLLLYADKRLGAGYGLINGGKLDLGVSTLTKAEKYLEQARILVEEIGGEDQLKSKVDKATRKHKEVLRLAYDKVGDDYRAVLNQIVVVNPVKEAVEIWVEVSIEVDGVSDSYRVGGAQNALEALKLVGVENNLEVRVKEYDFGVLVESIGGRENSVDKAWIYYVNGESATEGADQYELKTGDLITWKYIKPVF